MLAKTIIVLVIGALVFMSLYRPMYRVSATFAFAPTERRIMDAPFDGQIGKVFVEPGAVVTEGQPLVEMNTFELSTERSAAASEAESYRLEARRLRVPTVGDPQARVRNAEAAEAEEKMKAAEAKVKLIDKKLADAVIKAPFAGEVLEGDLKYKLGASVRRGEALMEVGKRDKLRGELKIADRDIQDVKVGQTGTLKTSSLPGDEYPIRITNVIPKPNAAEGDNQFLVHAEVDQASAQWLPGITGEARIDVKPKPLIWIWTHRLTDFVQLKLWSWGII
jgi:multidrug efflux pump subunit AcrA (membrane-fusion protein)